MKVRRWEKPSGRRRESGKESETRRTHNCWDLREPVSLATVPAGDNEHGGEGTQAKPQRPGWWGGGGAALGSYGQSGGANSTRKTWGALVGETAGHISQAQSPWNWGAMGRGGPGGALKAAEEETH